MDTSAYLSRQGWLGDGHSLHPAGRGIRKPLLVSKKGNMLGIGKKKNDAHADQWWARAFDATLKGLKVSKDEVTGKAENVTFGKDSNALQMAARVGARWAANGGLYGGFVKGEGMEGTMAKGEEIDNSPSAGEPGQRERVQGGLETEEGSRKGQTRDMSTKPAVRVLGEPTVEFRSECTTSTGLSKVSKEQRQELRKKLGREERKAHRRARRSEQDTIDTKEASTMQDTVLTAQEVPAGQILMDEVRGRRREERRLPKSGYTELRPIAVEKTRSTLETVSSKRRRRKHEACPE